MDKEKQIEEMAEDIKTVETDAGQKLLNETVVFVRKNHKYNSKKDFSAAHENTIYELTADALYEQGYRKINENEVVISKEELESMVNAKMKCISDMAIIARKETAEAILALIVPDCKSCDENWYNGCLCLRASISEKIAKEFGVDLGE